MGATCVTCGKLITEGDYRLVGVEGGTWRSLYAHRGICEAEIRERLTPNHPLKEAKVRPAPLMVEELTMEEPEPFPNEDELPWFGAERRR